MRKSKIIFSILISCLFLVSCRGTSEVANVYASPILKAEVNRFRVLITTNQAELTGIMIIKHMEGEWRGSLINEFGMKAFDFTVNNNKCRIKNAVSFMDKWHIRKTIESDLALLFNNRQKKGKLLEMSENEIILTNEKRGIKYNFYSIEN